MCLESSCIMAKVSYSSSGIWKNHYKSSHKAVRQTNCPFNCKIFMNSPPEDWYKHVAAHMREIRLMALSPSLLLDLGKGSESGTSEPKPKLRGLPNENSNTNQDCTKQDFLQKWLSKDVDDPTLNRTGQSINTTFTYEEFTDEKKVANVARK